MGKRFLKKPEKPAANKERRKKIRFLYISGLPQVGNRRGKRDTQKNH